MTPKESNEDLFSDTGQIDSSGILSNDEVDALLSAIHEGDVVVGEAGESKEQHKIRPYDFLQVSRLSRVDKQRLQNIHEGAAVSIGNAMSIYLRAVVECRLIALEELSYRSFAESIASNVHVVVLNISPMPGSGVIIMDTDLVLNIIDKSLGGPGIYSSSESILTEVETTIINTIVRDIIVGESLHGAWKENVEINWSIDRTESDMRVVQIARDDELMMSANFAIDGDLGFGRLIVCLPFSSIEEFVAGYGNIDTKQDKQDHAAVIRETVNEIPLKIYVSLGASEITVAELLSLNTGDVIRLESKVKNPLSLKVEEREKFFGRIGTCNKRKAVKIEERIK